MAQTMTAKQLWQEGLNQLKEISESPSLDALLLVCYSLKITKESYWRDPHQEANKTQKNKFFSLLAKRAQARPMAYLLREKEFWSHKFFVDERVLVPRVDTEVLVEKALELLQKEPQIHHIFDVGTGSGAIGLSLKLALKESINVNLIDISQTALEVAFINMQSLKSLPVQFHCSNLLSCFKTLPPFSLILANLPYLSEEEYFQKEKKYPGEPRLALYGGENKGLDLIEELLFQIKSKYQDKAWVYLEASSWQIPLIWRRMKELAFSELTVYKDLSAQDRIISGHL